MSEQIKLKLPNQPSDPSTFDEGFGRINEYHRYCDELLAVAYENPGDVLLQHTRLLETIDWRFHYGILRGLEKATRDRKPLDVSELIAYLNALQAHYFKWNPKARAFNYRDWIIASAASIIDNAMKFNGSEASESQIHSLVSWLLKSEEHVFPLGLNAGMNILNAVLNDTTGQIYLALLSCQFRLYDRHHFKGLFVPIRNALQHVVDSDEKDKRRIVFAVIGAGFSGLLTCDEQWMLANLGKLFDEQKAFSWGALISAYFISSSSINLPVLRLLAFHSLLSESINRKRLERAAMQKLAQVAVLGYFRGSDWGLPLSGNDSIDGLMRIMLSDSDSIYASEIVRYIYSIEKRENSRPDQGKLLNLLKSIILERDHDEKVLSELTLWISLFEAFDERTMPSLEIIAQHSGSDTYAFSFIEEINEKLLTYPVQASHLLKIHAMKISNLYLVERLRGPLNRLINMQREDLALGICNVLKSRGILLLTDICSNIVAT